MRGLGKFAGISTLSGILYVVTSEGLVLIINMTFGAALNAVYVIALQLKNSILSFALNVYRAIAPQITKTYASGEFEDHKTLVYMGSKMAVYMLYLVFFPFLFQANYIMHLWLGTVPPYTVEFAQAMAFVSLTYAAFEPIRGAVMATNHIAKFMLIPDGVSLFGLPIAYICAKNGDSPTILVYVVLLMEVLACVLRVYYGVQVSIIKVREVLRRIVVPICLVGSVQCGVWYAFLSRFSPTLKHLVFTILLNGITTLIAVYIVGMTQSERHTLRREVRKLWP